MRLFVRELPTTCFGESLKSGTLRIAEYSMVESVCLLCIFLICTISDLTHLWAYPVYFDFIPVVLFLLTLVKVIANGLLIQGTHKGVADYLKFWLYVYGINTGLMMLFMFLSGIAMSLLIPMKINAYLAGAQCIAFMLYCGLYKHFCQVVYAYKCQLDGSRDSALRPIVNHRDEV